MQLDLDDGKTMPNVRDDDGIRRGGEHAAGAIAGGSALCRGGDSGIGRHILGGCPYGGLWLQAGSGGQQGGFAAAGAVANRGTVGRIVGV